MTADPKSPYKSSIPPPAPIRSTPTHSERTSKSINPSPSRFSRSYSAHSLGPLDTTLNSMLKLKEELIRHIKSSTLTLSCKSAEETLNNLLSTLNNKIYKSYELLSHQAQLSLSKGASDLYENLKSRMLESMEKYCSNKGLIITPSSLPNYTLDFKFSARKNMPKLTGNGGRLKVYDEIDKHPGLLSRPISRFDESASDNDLMSELLISVEQSTQDLSIKLDHLSSQQIHEMVDIRMKKAVEIIMHDLTAQWNEMNFQIVERMQDVIYARLNEILQDNIKPAYPDFTVSTGSPKKEIPKLKLSELPERKTVNFAEFHTEFGESGTTQVESAGSSKAFSSPLKMQDLKSS
jgi:hypothetical protein